MRQKNITRLSIAAAVVAVILMGATSIVAGESEEKPSMGHPGMGGEAMMEEGMMAMHQKMHAKMKAMDEKLDALVAEMDAAGSRKKTDAVAAVVAELVSQRKAMHAMMMKMQPQMMEHMRTGMMEGMKQSMGDCPMMKKMPSGEAQESPEQPSEHRHEG
ncbi:MAG: hypothetical protein HKN37_06520 [Rhodothermales bacterium]|nr:hypothetical protein [Rhodothermales bacterium]